MDLSYHDFRELAKCLQRSWREYRQDMSEEMDVDVGGLHEGYGIKMIEDSEEEGFAKFSACSKNMDEELRFTATLNSYSISDDTVVGIHFRRDEGPAMKYRNILECFAATSNPDSFLDEEGSFFFSY